MSIARQLTAVDSLRVGLAILSFSACTGQFAEQPPSAVQTLTVGHVMGVGRGELVSLLTKEGLVRTTPDGQYEPLLAESWETADHEDGTQTVTFELRKGVTFHDGTNFDASVAKRFLEGSRAGRRGGRYPGLADIQEITATNPHRLDVLLRQPSSFFFDTLTIGIYPDEERRTVGTGPFALEAQTDDAVALVANQHYYRGKSSIDVVSLQRYPTLRTAWAAMMRDEVDVLHGVPVFAREFVEGGSNIDLHTMVRPRAFAVGFNRSHTLFQDSRVRRALNHAIDRASIVEAALRGDGRPASGVWALDRSYGGVERVYEYNPQLADTLLTEAGYPPAEPAATAAEDVPSRFAFLCLVPMYPNSERIALLIQRQLGEVGVHMQIEAVPPNEFPEGRLRDGTPWDAVLAPHRTGRAFSRPYGLWHSSAVDNIYGYSSADEALDAYRWASDADERTRAARRFQQQMYDDPPAIFLVEEEQARAVNRRFVIPNYQPGRDLIETMWLWEDNGRRLLN